MPTLDCVDDMPSPSPRPLVVRLAWGGLTQLARFRRGSSVPKTARLAFPLAINDLACTAEQGGAASGEPIFNHLNGEACREGRSQKMPFSEQPAALSAPPRSASVLMRTPFVAREILQRADLADRQAKLAQIVSLEIVPRLLTRHPAAAVESPVPISGCSLEEIHRLAELVLGTEFQAATDFVISLRDRGLTMDALFISLLEPVARHLGEMWDEDLCDFINVTLGLARLQELLAIFNSTHIIPCLDDKRSFFLTVAPGEQHFFGAAMVEKFLVAGGWGVHALEDASLPRIACAVADRWFAVAGVTLASEAKLDSLSSAVAAIRRSSRNPAIGIMVGGPLFNARPDLVQLVGADASAINAPAAVIGAQRLFDVAAKRDWQSSLAA